MAVPQGVNAQYYQTGRGLGLYQGAQPLAVEPPVGTPAWWQNEGIKDAVNGWPSRTGIETPQPGQQTTGQSYLSPGQQYPAPNPGVVREPSWVDDYWSAYLWALQDPGTAAQRVTESNWTSDYKRGLSDGLARRAPSDPRGLVPTVAQLALLPAGIAALIGAGGGSGTGGVRTPPVYVPRPGTTGGVYVPPPPLPAPTAPAATVQATYEIYGARRGRPVPMREALTFDGSAYHLKNGYQILVGLQSSDGFGLGGRPGSWPSIYPGISPAAYGLDADKGVVDMDDGRKPRAVPASDLAEIFGASWRTQVYGVGVTSPPAMPGPAPAPAAYPDGTLLKSSLHPEVFIMDLGAKRWIASATVFQNYGYSYAAIQIVDQGVLDSIPNGPPLTA